MNITATMVSDLRRLTGAGMMDCKKALEKTAGDMQAAEIEIAKAGNRKAEKTASRTAAEGLITLASGPQAMALVEVNCETDFVARDTHFTEFCQKTAEQVLKNQNAAIDPLKAQVEADRQALVGKIGENLQVRRAAYLAAPAGQVIGAYVHSGKIGVLVQLIGGDAAIAKDIAMHVAASRPEYLSAKTVPADRIAKETDIFMAQSESSGKSKEIIEKMVQGKLNKYLAEICLLSQPFVKNPDQTVAQFLQEKKAEVVTYIRLAVGEGIEKKTANFADEVAGMMGGK